MKKIVTVDGNEACSRSAYLFTEVAGIYPITPSSPMAEHVDEWSNAGVENLFGDSAKVVEMQSEAGAAGMVHGSLQAGCLTTTFTASQGLLLMIPNMYKMAGELLPAVFHVAARSLSTHALSIFGDHQDIYATRQTGFCMLASSSVQEAADLAIVAHASAIKGSLPFLHFFDGFRTSHELQKIEILEKEDVRSFLDEKALKHFRNRALNITHPFTRGTAENDDIYFQATEVRNGFYDKIPDIVEGYMQKIYDLTGREYHPFEYYGSNQAKEIIVAMGSVTETIKETIDHLNQEGYEVGLITVHLYRPFSTDYLLKVLPDTVERVAVLDRTKEPGSEGEPLYLDVVSALRDKDVIVVGGRYGLSSKNTMPAMIKAVYDMLKGELRDRFVIGIDDDVTNLSLSYDANYKISRAEEFLIYGYGSDGMVSAEKSIIKLIGDHTDHYVQGYFQYDSKKSGGVTVGHLRFSESPIRSTYYVENPRLVVVTKDSYLDDFDCLSNIQENGIFILNTTMTKEEFLDRLSDQNRHVLIDKKVKVYIINAYELARKVGLKNKISTIMESAIMSLTTMLDYEFAKEKMKEYAKQRFFKKGPEIYEANKEGIDKATSYLEEVRLDGTDVCIVEVEEKTKDVFTAMTHRMGDMLPTSAFLSMPDGTFEPGTSRLEKRGISDLVPSWISENCIQCTQCSFVCPHAVIRPYLLSQAEYEKAPEMIQRRAIKPIEKNLEDYYFVIGISVEDCTGCGLCMKTCPGKAGKKALISKELIEQRKNQEQEIFEYLSTHIKDKKKHLLSTIKGTQFREPKFMFHGACAGCGETPYLKLLTQLFGDEMIIANATGCSSIYGASAPSTPYMVPWASSLFEDNAEYGYGMLIANNVIRNRIASIMKANMDNPNHELFTRWLENCNNYEVTKEIYEALDFDTIPEELQGLKDYIVARSIWTIGGDGWAYDIGFGGIDHVLASNDNVNILVLNSEVYSNTGGQSSKASPKGSIAAFTSSGKKVAKKDLARVAMAYPHVYVAQVSMGATPMQTIKAFQEAANYNGPSIIIAYSPCISHGIKGGMENSIESEKMATNCGYFPTFRYHPETKQFTLDSKKVDFDQYENFLNSQTRYKMLKEINPEKADELLASQKENARARFEYYQTLEEESKQKTES